MPSFALQRWRGTRLSALNEMESAHQSVGGAGRGRRYATQQINQGYAILLASHFQGFCRDLYTECANALVRLITAEPLRTYCENALLLNLRLNQGNPNPGNLGSDFKRLGLSLWEEVAGLDPRNEGLQNGLERLNAWRNAIAHQDFNPAKLGSTTLGLKQVREWRRVCERLAVAFDAVLRRHLTATAGAPPW